MNTLLLALCLAAPGTDTFDPSAVGIAADPTKSVVVVNQSPWTIRASISGFMDREIRPGRSYRATRQYFGGSVWISVRASNGSRAAGNLFFRNNEAAGLVTQFRNTNALTLRSQY